MLCTVRCTNIDLESGYKVLRKEAQFSMEVPSRDKKLCITRTLIARVIFRINKNFSD